MTHPHVRLRLPDASVATLGPGTIIGRGTVASLRLADPRVSEAHAIVSLRGRELRLISLGGAVLLDGRPEVEIALETGQDFLLADAIPLHVVEVTLPSDFLALRIGTLPPRELCAETYSLVAVPELDLVPRYVPDAEAHVWCAAEGWVIRFRQGRPEAIEPGRAWRYGDEGIVAVLVPLADVGFSATVGHSRLPPLTLVVRFTTAHIFRRGREPVAIDGLPARVLSELALMSCPAHWSAVADTIWKDEPDQGRLRKNWDRAIRRLRLQLREEGIRDNLIRTDGVGNHELYLMPGDLVRDET